MADDDLRDLLLPTVGQIMGLRAICYLLILDSKNAEERRRLADTLKQLLKKSVDLEGWHKLPPSIYEGFEDCITSVAQGITEDVSSDEAQQAEESQVPEP